MCSPSPPPPPDYQAAARAQGDANIQTAVTQSRLNNPNIVNPFGTQTWSENFDQAGYDAAMPKRENFTRPGSINPRNQGILNPSSEKYSYGPSVFDQVGYDKAMPNRADFLGRPSLTQAYSPEQQALYGQSTRTKGLLGKLGQQGAESLLGVIGKPLDYSGAPQVGNYDETRQRVIDAMNARSNEDYGIQTDDVNSNLIAAGIRPGTKAYADRMQMIERSRNDQRQQAEIAGGNAAAQAAAVDTQKRKDYIAELLAQRGIPLNEITALMSGSQVSNPFAVPGPAQNTQVGQTPTYNAALQAGQYGTDVYNAQVGQSNATQSGLFSLGVAGIAL